MPNQNPSDAISPQKPVDTTDGGAGQRMAEQAWAPGLRATQRATTDAPPNVLQPMQLADRAAEVDRIKNESVGNSIREIGRQGGGVQGGDKRQQQIFEALRTKVLNGQGPNGTASLADQGWEIYQSAKDSPADKAHMDFVLVNRQSGQYYFLDSTGKDKNTGALWAKGVVKYENGDFDTGAPTNSFVDRVIKQLRELTSKPSPLTVSDFPPPPLKKLDSEQATVRSLEDFQYKLRATGDPELRRYAQDIQRSTDHANTSARAEATPQAKREAFDAQAKDARNDVMREMLTAMATGKTPFMDRTYRASGFEIRGNDIIYKNGADTFKLPVTREEVTRWYNETRDAELKTNSSKLDAAQQRLKEARASNQPDDKIKQEIKQLQDRDEKLIRLRQVRLTDEDVKRIAERIVTKLSAKTPGQLTGMAPPAAVEAADHSSSRAQRVAESRFVATCQEIGREGLVRQMLESRNIPRREARDLEERLLAENRETRERARVELEHRIGREGVRGLERDLLAEGRKPGGGRLGEACGKLGSVAIVVGTLVNVFSGEGESN